MSDVEQTSSRCSGGLIETRADQIHAKQRLRIEELHEARAAGGHSAMRRERMFHALIGAGLRLTGLYWRGQRNAADVRLLVNPIASPRVPSAFAGFRILQLSDFHADISRPAMARVEELVADLHCDLCVLTGDYRGETFGPFNAALEGVARVLSKLKVPVYGVLGNHDSIRMLPALEDLGVRMLMNESVRVARGSDAIQLAGVDDANFFRLENFQKAAAGIGSNSFSLLLCHTPEVFRQAEAAGFDIMLAGHTHGGQLCLPGSIPLTLSCKLPRAFGAGAWSYEKMAGYTSVGIGTSGLQVRLNCRPEITIHELLRLPDVGQSVV